MQSGYDINYLVREAQTRWLKPVEVHLIIQNFEEHQLTHKIPQKPASGSLFLFNKRALKFFRKDGHSWRKRRDQRTIAEAHERLKVRNVEAINCYYAHGECDNNFQRRSYWMLDPAYEHIVLVHYRDISKGKENNGSTPQFSTLSSSTFSPSPYSFATDQPESSFVIDESRELYHNESSPSSVEITSGQVIVNSRINLSDNKSRTDEVSSSSLPDLGQALRRIEQQLSLNDDEMKKYDTIFIENEASNDLENVLGNNENSCRPPNDVVDIWEEMLHSSNDVPNDQLQEQFGRSDASSLSIKEADSLQYPAYSPGPHAYRSTPDCYSSLFEQDVLGIPLENNISLTISQKQKFTIREISPEWCYTSEGAKIFIIGSFLCNPSESSSWACVIGDTEVPAQVIQEGVLCCHAPPHLLGKVHISVTCGNRESCSEVREFEYRPKTDANKSSEELLLLVRFVQMLLLSNAFQNDDALESRVDLLGKSRNSEDLWSHIIDALLVGSTSTSSTLDWLLQELLKDKLEMWLSYRLQTSARKECFLSKKEQGIIHMVAGLGFEWALQPILNAGVSVNFRDINGWTALHWAARFGREKMVAALIASSASAGAVTDPNSHDPTGKTPASIAATCGHKGLAGYLSEIALTTHLSSLTLAETELSRGSAALEAERTVDSLSMSAGPTPNEDLRHTLAAVRNAAQAAARIQSAFRAHSFHTSRERERMESDKKVKIIEKAIRNLMEKEEEEDAAAKGNTSTSPKALHEDQASAKATRRRRFLSDLLSDLESMEEEKDKANSEEIGNSETIMKEIRVIKKQNVTTQWLLSGMIVLTVAWQLSEVSLMLKIKDGLTNPFKFIGGFFKRSRHLNDNNNNLQDMIRDMSENQNRVFESTSLPGLKIPHLEFPGFDSSDDDEGAH
ncbi:Calmodulin-binding transcription activator 4 [Striga hermonthica]|uniref:Calmodulin-binding transcription activator 4 n=1 Tax=Striga hermonthica TaxID=68872 RepID=A0A9N7NKA9_STRHE|nr:Calmodulin-binding transcription activator 4 [Striga hermonthica]